MCTTTFFYESLMWLKSGQKNTPERARIKVAYLCMAI